MSRLLQARLLRLEAGANADDWPDRILISAVPLGDTAVQREGVIEEAKRDGRYIRTPQGVHITARDITVEEWLARCRAAGFPAGRAASSSSGSRWS